MEKYQTLYPRALALILDSVLLLPLGILDEWMRTLTLRQEILYILLFGINIASILYFIIMHGLFGQTVGKMLMKVKVLDISESSLKFRQAVLRDLPQILFIIGSFIFMNPLLLSTGEMTTEALDYFKYPLVILMLLWGFADVIVFFTNDKFRALHDYIAGSVVVKINNQ